MRCIRNDKSKPTFALVQAPAQLIRIELRPCKVCFEVMTISSRIPGGRRRQSKYCSNACNQKAKRMRAKETR